MDESLVQNGQSDISDMEELQEPCHCGSGQSYSDCHGALVIRAEEHEEEPE